MERLGAQGAQGGDQVGEEEQARDEVPIAYVNVVQVGVRLHAAHLVRKMGEISRPERSLDQ
jgi:hypothetical protein